MQKIDEKGEINVKINDVLYILATSLGSIIVLFFLTKMMGYKQLSQLSMFDYINGITIGSIAAELATSLEDDFLKPLTAMIVYATMAFLISILCNKSIRMRRFFTGEPIILIDDGKIYKDNLSKARIDIDDLLTQCRNDGYFNPSDIQFALMESNGKISFLPKAYAKTVSPKDLGLNPEQEKAVSNVIMDGKIMEENLNYTGNNKEWLDKKLKSQGIKDVKNIFLATCDNNNNLSVFMKISGKDEKDIFL